ncbi:hypothetical protein [Selenomonas ruminantium]|uniref:Uncharacterized protein n=1 Tax=Selenomonas ruminantium TaxID=971 RepID=A0A1H0PUI5_SELRU|nr:hypothetical protein [Selenomonas ruminantium]SDP08674.1 hypothetical protein SAMN05216366_10618 [Selenomonas ruminantium]
MKITHDCLQVRGIPCSRILELELYHAPNACGMARLVLETTAQEMEYFIPRAGKDLVRLVVCADGTGEKNIFCGYLDELDYELSGQYAVVTCTLADACILLDLRRQDQTYQNQSESYQAVLQRAYDLAGVAVNLSFGVKDKPVGRFLAQMQETAWEFSKRLASHFHTALFTRMDEPVPALSVGLPNSDGTVLQLNGAEAVLQQDNRRYWRYRLQREQAGSEAVPQDFQRISCESDTYACLGTEAEFRGKSYVISKVHGSLRDGLLHMTYELADKRGVLLPWRYHPGCGGRIIKGKVQSVERDRIKVWFDGMDDAYDSSGSTWFPYSTGYSSQDGSGWYVMPEQEDEVRILFPSHDEDAAFGASAVNQAPAPSERNKYFRAPGGNNVLMDEDGITLDCVSADSFIRISQSRGIQIYSNRPITISAEKDITLDGKEGVIVMADESITLQVGKSNIHMDAKEIGMGADTVAIGEGES